MAVTRAVTPEVATDEAATDEAALVSPGELPALHGVVPILLTPFDDHGRIDEESLRRLVDFTIAAGVHGLGIALGSEVYKLTEAERDAVLGTVVDEARGRVPVMMNTGTQATNTAVSYSERAEALGASAVICTSPGSGLPVAEVRHYFSAVAQRVHVPVIIQDTATNHVPPALIRSLGEDCANIRYAKVESAPAVLRVYEAVRACGSSMGIFGGAGGGGFLQELRRGSVGTMPWASTPGPFVEVWNRWQLGDSEGARQVFDTRLAPVLRVAAGSLGAGHVLHKELLRRQGVIASAHVRRPAEQIDPVTLTELDEVCAALGLGAQG
jgi:4-hydroxy-tetrahydrodipicolinate synthase